MGEDEMMGLDEVIVPDEAMVLDEMIVTDELGLADERVGRDSVDCVTADPELVYALEEARVDVESRDED